MAFTNAERQARKRAKARMLQPVAQVSGPGGLEKVSDIVVGKVRDLLLAGVLTPTIKDALNAEKMQDARAAHTDTQRTAIALAMILSGASSGGPPAHLLVGDGLEIEGEAFEILRPSEDDE